MQRHLNQQIKELPITQHKNQEQCPLITAQLKIPSTTPPTTTQSSLLETPQKQLNPNLQTTKEIQVNYSIPEDGILPGGRITYFLHNWQKITSHPWPLQIVKEGYQLQFTSHPVPWKTVHHPISKLDQ